MAQYTREELLTAIDAATKDGNQPAIQQLQGMLENLPQESKAPEPAGETNTPQGQFTPGITLDERMKRLGIDPEVSRNAISPFYRTQPYKKGKPFWEGMEFRAPQFAVDMVRGAMLPGHAMQGGSYDESDVTKMALDTLPLGRSPASTKRMPTKSQFIKDAPTTDELSRAAGKLYDKMDAAGIHAGGKALSETIEKMQSFALKEGTDLGKDSLTPYAKKVVNGLDEIAGTEPSLRWMENTRRKMGSAVDKAFAKGDKNDARIVMGIMDMLDDYIDNLSGLPAKARNMWHKKAKSEVLDRMIERATNSASGFENGLKNEANRLMKNERRLRGFTDAEKKAIKRIANGGPLVSFARMVRHAGLPIDGQENRFLGAFIGMAGGGMAGGAEGAIGAVAAGTLGGKAAQAMTKKNADMARAIAATGGEAPKTRGLLNRTAPRAAGILGATQIYPDDYKGL